MPSSYLQSIETRRKGRRIGLTHAKPHSIRAEESSSATPHLE
jgi:hypothetical protein